MGGRLGDEKFLIGFPSLIKGTQLQDASNISTSVIFCLQLVGIPSLTASGISLYCFLLHTSPNAESSRNPRRCLPVYFANTHEVDSLDANPVLSHRGAELFVGSLFPPLHTPYILPPKVSFRPRQPILTNFFFRQIRARVLVRQIYQECLK